AENISEAIKHLPLEQNGRTAVDERIQELNAHFLEEIAFLYERSLRRGRRSRDRWTGPMALRVHQVRRQVVDHGEEDHVQWLLLVVHIEDIVHVRDAHLRREASIDGSAL